jgi:Family of unknown function (DUF6261)
MISSLNWSLFPSDEFFTFCKRSLVIVEPLRPLAPTLAPFIDRAINSNANFQAALERETKNPVTLQLASKDLLCDSSFMAFRLYVEAASYRTSESWRTAAAKILEVIRKHGWTAYNLGYKAQAAAETNIVSEIRSKCSAEMETIMANDWFEEFVAAFDEFETAFNQSITAAPVGQPTIFETRPELVKNLKALFSMISLLNSNDDAIAEFDTVEAALNELITTSLASVKAADTRAENQKKAEASTAETAK